MIARIIALIVFGGFAAMFLDVGTMQFLQQRRNLAHAEPVDALIVHSTVKMSKTRDTDQRVGFSNSATSYLPEVRFRYTVAGREYESERLHPSIIEQSFASEREAAAVLAPFPLQATVRAHVNKAHPDQAFLIAEKSSGPIVFLTLGALLPPLGWIVGKYV